MSILEDQNTMKYAQQDWYLIIYQNNNSNLIKMGHLKK